MLFLFSCHHKSPKLKAEDAKSASDENIKKMDAVLTALDELGIPEEDVVTSGYRVQPRYNWREDEEKLIGFQVRNSLVITLKNIDYTDLMFSQPLQHPLL